MESAVPEIISILLVLVSPLITSIFTKTNMSSATKHWVAVGVSALIAGVYVFMNGGFDNITSMDQLVTPLALAYALGQFAYNTILKRPATYVEANVGLKPVTAVNEGDKSAVEKVTQVDGSEALVAVPETPKPETPKVAVPEKYKNDGPVAG